MSLIAPPTTPLPRRALLLTLALLGPTLPGCAVGLFSTYDSDSTERVTDIARVVFKLYQDLLALPPEQRAAAFSAAEAVARRVDTEGQMRLHLLREEARAMNRKSAQAARHLLEAWLEVLRSHAADPANSFSDEALLRERTQMEHQLRAALRSEEMKKFIKGPFEFLL